MGKYDFIAGGCILAIALGQAACGGRPSNPVALENSYDAALSCGHLAAEYEVNHAKIASLDEEREFERGNNVGMLLALPLFMDLSDTEKKEIEALFKRNEHLTELMEEKSCPPVENEPEEEIPIEEEQTAKN